MKKSILSLTLVISIISSMLTLLPIYVSANTDGYYTYTISNGQATITQYNETISGDIIIPDTLGGYPVTHIGDKAFYSCYGLTSIRIPSSVTSVGQSAFQNCRNLTHIELQNGIKSIGYRAFTNCRNLVSIVIPKSVTSIGEYLFASCENLTNVSIPDSITIIPEGTFIGCNNLTSVLIPNSITSIGDVAFYGCGLTSICIPSSIKNIGDGNFSYCTDLLNIKLMDGVKTIGERVFSYCESLESIVVPKSVTSIGGTAFYKCGNLKNVYYCGNKDDWDKVYIGLGDTVLSNATIHYNSGGSSAGTIEYKKPQTLLFQEFKFSSGSGTGDFKYDDNYFANSAYTYNHDLARMSIRLALSAFAKKTGSGENKDYTKQYANVKDLLEKCNFEEIDWNIDYEEKPWVNGIGVIAGNKKIAYDDGNYTLVAVALRGGNYEAEWGGNFNLGNGEYHAGFEQASGYVIQFLQEYMDEYGITGDVKLWITGYSRAAATTNLTAAYFDEYPERLSDDATLQRKDIYAYCFETPAGVVDPYDEDGIYNNIFSIVNQHDFVPMVAMRKWDFDRYGVTKYLPTSQTNNNYNNLFTRMILGYDEYIGNNKANISEDKKDYYRIDNFSKFSYIAGITGTHDYINAQGVYLEKVLDKLADVIGSTANYEDNYQDAFVYIGEEIIGYKNISDFLEQFLLELSARAAVKESFYLTGDILISDRYIIEKSLKETFNYFGVTISTEDIDVLVSLIIDLGIDDIITIAANIKSIAQAHYPELCLAWLDAIDETDFSNRRLRTLYLNCPVDLEVYDSNNNLVAAVYENVPQEIDGSSIVCYIDANGQKVVYLPTDEEYRIEVIATDDSEVTYSIQEQNAETGETKVINYNKMAMKKNDTLTGTAENLAETAIATYALTSNSVTVEEPEVIENATPVTVTPASEGNGNVTGGGSLLKGEYAQFTAMPFENETFLGWYNGETLISSDTTYRFQVAEETTLTAKFTENTCEVAFLSQDDDVVYVKRILKGNKVAFPTMNQNENYMIFGVFTDKYCLNSADENTTYAEDTVLYLDCVHKNNWVQFNDVNNKLIVYTPVAMSNVQLFVALYEKEKLTELKPNAIDLVIGKNEFENPITNMGTADMLKIFVWDGLSSLKPIFKNCVVDLKE